ncbi:tetratricopeptide repeat protein [Cerasicoccus frondis]|uniref:tetratricopeptide repeat protein n=1 Tax=Cerasicoccus frondis TaxID=490090 RepID=UPI0028525B86|nr:tetratricopeptide repeat protein [Cerasicoccus frondis]
MKQQYRTQLARLWLLLAILFLTACGGKDGPPDEASIQQAISAANELVYENQVPLAIQRLEELEAKSPGNPQVIEALAFAYAKQPDPMMAALYFDQAFQLNPTNADLALYAASTHRESGNAKAATQAYRDYLELNPDDAAAWKALGQVEFEQKHTQAALDAYLEAFRRSRQTPTHEEAALIGHLYHSLNNRAQATKWYMQALRPGGAPADRLNAQLGLFEIALRDKQWPHAADLMDQIEKEFPGELSSGPYASARQELLKWRSAQNALRGTIGASAPPPVVEEPVAEAPAVAEAETVEMTEEELLAASAAAPAVVAENVTVVTEVTAVEETPTAVDTNIAATPTESVSVATNEGVITPTASGDLVVSNTDSEEPPAATSLGNVNDEPDLVMAKALPTPSVEELDLTEEMQAPPTVDMAEDEGALEVDEVTIATADAEAPTEETVAEVKEVKITRTPDGGVEVTTVDAQELADGEIEVEQGRIEIDPPAPNMSPADRAKLAYEAEDYMTAIRFYREAIASDYRNAELAYNLSRAYYNNGQYREAEIYASEATRLAPNDVRYTLNYLRAIQRTMSRDALMRELVKAKERFPNSPDITLALGRAYEVIMGNTRNARFLYEEFVQMAPNHPRAADIQAKLQTLPR